MGTAATRAKQKWNSGHYTNVAVAMNPVMVAQLREDCKMKGISVASVIAELVAGYLNTEAPISKEKALKKTVDNRGWRRKKLWKLIAEIESICNAEETYLCNIVNGQ